MDISTEIFSRAKLICEFSQSLSAFAFGNNYDFLALVVSLILLRSKSLIKAEDCQSGLALSVCGRRRPRTPKVFVYWSLGQHLGCLCAEHSPDWRLHWVRISISAASAGLSLRMTLRNSILRLRELVPWPSSSSTVLNISTHRWVTHRSCCSAPASPLPCSTSFEYPTNEMYFLFCIHFLRFWIY